MFKPVDPRQDLNQLEKDILESWKENKTFERSIQNRRAAPVYSFFDGPPFATGVPHFGTLLSSVAKDVIPRYWTMKGFRVDRRWGWDCHGLPAEHLVEKKLGINSKNEIENKIGIEKFNKECCETVNQMADEWEILIDRVGRWVDYKNAYRTMDKEYMESVWWAFKELYQKDLIYEDVRISLYCPRCETPLANFEIAMDNSYQEVSDPSVFVKFKITDGSFRENTLLVWTTTPWTLPANTALAVGQDITYVRIKTDKRETLIIAKDRLDELKSKHAVLEEIKGSDLKGASYSPPFPEFAAKGGKTKHLHKIWTADFVSTQEGSGIVHIAPAFGQDDFNLSQKNDIPVIENIDSTGRFIQGKWQGKRVWQANAKIIHYLKEKKILYKKKNITHSYPFCHRCHTKLIYKTQPAWYVNIEKLRKKLLDNNEQINSQPPHLKHGRFKKSVQAAPDWNISRDRYWGTAMPVWRCDKCKEIRVMGSYQELYELSGQNLEDYHRPFIDQVDFKCQCGGVFKRVPQVMDCWFESGSMPYAERHYPFENQEDFSQKFPTDFISEYISQTRAWFYVLHVLATALFDQPAFKNVVTTGIITGQDGRKMSKSLGNYTDPKKILDQYGADALRFYLMSSPIMEAKNINFNDKDIAEIRRGLISTFWNSYSFFVTYALVDKFDPNEPQKIINENSQNILDRWIISELNFLIKKFQKKMDSYQIARAARLIPEFCDKLSNWYIRRSRRRFWKSKNDQNKKHAYETLWQVLVKFSQVMAPFLPFISENVYKNLTSEESVHLSKFPEADEKLIDQNLAKNMEKTRKTVKIALGLRARQGIKTRQPLSRLCINQKNLVEDLDFKKIIQDEVNIKDLYYLEDQDFKKKENLITAQEDQIIAGLNPKITLALKNEGYAREIIRNIQEMRRKADFSVDDRIKIAYQGGNSIFNGFGYLIARETLAKELKMGKLKKPKIKNKIKLENKTIIIELENIKA
ncbi:isoleucine--tRNA ligase [Patescibacteria group bacterium]|nr:isoleucine--tRNA ligase [Patescibacteria group bacterium]